MNIKTDFFTKVIKMPSWNAWVQRPCGLIKLVRRGKHFKWRSKNCLIKVENVS
jgi:hypothetical protein